MTSTASQSSQSSRVCRVMVADNHPVVRQGLSEYIQHQPDLEMVGEATSPSEVLDALDQTQPTVLVSDLTFEGVDGIELIKDLKARRSTLRVLVLSIHDETFYAQRVLKAGAMGYLMKDEPMPRVIEGIRAVHQGRICLSEKMAQTLLSQMSHTSSTGPRSMEPSYGLESLTDRELEVLRLMGQGQSTREIASDLHLSVKTVETHRENLKHKLQLENGSQLVRYAVRFVVEAE